MDRLQDWTGALSSMPRGVATDTLVFSIKSEDSGTRPLLGVCASGRSFWIKPLGNPQGDDVLVSERVVSGVGELIGAPVRPTALVKIPSTLVGTFDEALAKVRTGVAHGSLHLESAERSDDVLHVRRGDNPTRVVGLAALWDWCLGADEQWLYDGADNKAIWSFDHGIWIGQGYPWSATDMPNFVQLRHAWEFTLKGADPEAFERVAQRLESVTADQILGVLAEVPSSWPVTDEDLEALGWMLWSRRQPAADRLRQLAPRASR